MLKANFFSNNRLIGAALTLILAIFAAVPVPAQDSAGNSEQQGGIASRLGAPKNLAIRMQMPAGTPYLLKDSSADDPVLWMVVENGQDTTQTIGIKNNFGETLKAHYYLESGTATLGADYDFANPASVADILLEHGSQVVIDIKAYAEPPPHDNLHETFEILARVAAYEDWTKGENLENRLTDYSLRGMGYWVDEIFPEPFGFYAVGLTSDEYFTLKVDWLDEYETVIQTSELTIIIYDLDRPPILTIRGTNAKSPQDAITDGDPNGVGHSQFIRSYDEVEDWLKMWSNPRGDAFSFKPHIVGHSLGGALAQWMAATYTYRFGNNGKLGQIVTFNSPGIAKDAGVGQGASYFEKANVDSVTHYITSGDPVSMAGERYLPAADNGNSGRPNWVKSAYEAGIDSTFEIFEKHSVPVITAEILKDEWLQNPIDSAHNGKVEDYPDTGGLGGLDSSLFTYLPDPDYFAFQLKIAKTVVLAPHAAALTFRGTTERLRKDLGGLVFPIGSLVIDEIDAYKAARGWRPFVYDAIIKMSKAIAGLESDGSLQKRLVTSASSGAATNFWEAAAQWPSKAWQVSELWRDEAWEAMTEWRPEQWAATVSADFPWEDTTSWSREEWENVNVVSILSPLNNAAVSVNLPVKVRIFAPVDAREVSLQVDSSAGGQTLNDLGSPWEIDWTPKAEVTYYLQAIAFLADGGIERSATITVFAEEKEDHQPPSVRFVDPSLKDGAIISGTIVVEVEARDNVGVREVNFYVDDRFIASDSSSPYTWVWDTSGLQPGSNHRLKVEAYDGAGHRAEETVTLTIGDSDAGPQIVFENLSPGAAISTPFSVHVRAVYPGGSIGKVQLSATSPTGDLKILTTDKPLEVGGNLYAFAWETESDGLYAIRAWFTDSDSDQTVASTPEIQVSVQRLPDPAAVWIKHKPDVHPRGRALHRLVYDEKRSRTVLFGGTTGRDSNWSGGTHFNDLWEWDSATSQWTNRTPPNKENLVARGLWPSKRYNHLMVYDASRRRVLIYGGCPSTTQPFEDELNDLWEWDGATGQWTNRTPHTLPESWPPATGCYSSAMRAFGATNMMYDSSIDRTVLYHQDSYPYSAPKTLWVWNGHSGVWRRIFPEALPATPSGYSYDSNFVFDANRGVGYLLRGFQNDWEWMGGAATWQKLPPDNGGASNFYQPKRMHFGATFDRVQDQVLMFGGGFPNSSCCGYKRYYDVWTYDPETGDWTEITPAQPNGRPLARLYGQLAYNPAWNRTLLFGGDGYNFSFDDTWELSFVENWPPAGSPPIMLAATEKNFRGKYGYGIALKWTAELPQNAAYYHIQYSVDGKEWVTYLDDRGVEYAGWINHHGNFRGQNIVENCEEPTLGETYQHCLPSGQVYYYRVKVLDSDKTPLTDWSNVIAAKVATYGNAPVNKRADGVYFSDTWGWGMALEWESKAVPGETYYEIQYATQLNDANWTIYQNRRDVSHGGWINHHRAYSGDKFERSLPAGQHYYYRVRVLDSGGSPITDWSNISSGRVLDYLVEETPPAPVLQQAHPTLFPAPDGPGIALSWTPTTNPQAAYYTVQFSEDNGATWKVYTAAHDVSDGAWINHQGNLVCGDGFERCLKSNQRYAYRVGVLDSTRRAISEWSNFLSATSMDWENLAPENQPPTIRTPGYEAVHGKETLTFSVTAIDPDGDQVEILVEGLPADGATIAPTRGTGAVTATFHWKPGGANIGSHRIAFTARDEHGAESTTKVTTIMVCDDIVDCPE